ncbi:hypothetical protein X777_08967, partial [Ooceraea biroi]
YGMVSESTFSIAASRHLYHDQRDVETGNNGKRVVAVVVGVEAQQRRAPGVSYVAIKKKDEGTSSRT